MRVINGTVVYGKAHRSHKRKYLTEFEKMVLIGGGFSIAFWVLFFMI